MWTVAPGLLAAHAGDPGILRAVLHRLRQLDGEPVEAWWRRATALAAALVRATHELPCTPTRMLDVALDTRHRTLAVYGRCGHAEVQLLWAGDRPRRGRVECCAALHTGARRPRMVHSSDTGGFLMRVSREDAATHDLYIQQLACSVRDYFPGAKRALRIYGTAAAGSPPLACARFFDEVLSL